MRFDSKLRHIGIGARHKRREVVLFIADREVRILTADGQLLRQLTLDPRRDYQPQSLGVAVQLSTMSRDICLRCPDT